MKIIEKALLYPKNFIPSFKGIDVKGAFNPAAIRMPNGKIVLYVRVAEGFNMRASILKFPKIVSDKYDIEIEEIPNKKVLGKKEVIELPHEIVRLKTMSHFRRVILDKTGFNVEEIDQKPIFTGTPSDGNYGVEDPRIVKIKDKYYMTYVSVSDTEDVSTSLAVSSDLKNWERKGIIFRKQNKDVVLFPEKISGKYIALHRPQGDFEFDGPSIWISHSDDMIHWGEEKNIIEVRKSGFDVDRIGSGPPPFKTKKGWLLIYHGVRVGRGKKIYSTGVALLDLKNPEKVLARSSSNKPLFEPKHDYEKKGFENNIIFPTGIVLDSNKKDLLIYFGAADKVTSVKKVSLDYIFKNLEYYK
jgi:predicted GH43/DUF377 family glycosyl hydrolase